MTQVWQLDLPCTDKIVLLALADHANDTGICWPSITTIAKKTSLAERSVRYSLRRLEKAGHLSTQNRYGRSHLFSVTPVSMNPLHKMHPGTTCPSASDAP